ncbi:MAG: glutamine synthetase [Aaplasma endosymbiont of Hyalomma asiaticum]
MQKKLGMCPVVGVELEFYVKGDADIFDIRLIELGRQLRALNLCVYKETCKNQYEVRTSYTRKISRLLTDLLSAKNILFSTAAEDGIALDFSAKPHLDMAGSAFHVHVNVVDEKAQNLFLIDKPGKMSEALLHSIGGLCSLMKKHMICFAPKESSYSRYKCPDIHTPTTVSWGGNNRSTALRLLNTTSSHEKCRIEHRVPGADCDYEVAISAILIGIIRGIEQKLIPPPKIFGLASDPQYKLEKLPTSLNEAKSLHAPLSL